MTVGAIFEGDVPSGNSGSSVHEEASKQRNDESNRTREERKLAIMTMNKKKKRLFDQIMKSRRKKIKEVIELRRKRKIYDDELKTDDSKRIKL